MKRPRLGFIGAGRLARALAPLLVKAGYRLAGIASRAPGSAERIAREADVVLLSVPDRALASVAQRLARGLGDELRGKIVLHHAGALGTGPLAPCARVHASTGVLHPLVCLGLPRLSAVVVPGSWARVEGDARAVRMARRLARDLGLRVLPFPLRPSDAQRLAYHAAASLVANDLVALLAIAAGLFEEVGIDERTALRALARLGAGALLQAQAGGIPAALTGPAARGDRATLGAQIRRIARSSRVGADAHRALSRELARLAGKTDRPGKAGRSPGSGV